MRLFRAHADASWCLRCRSSKWAEFWSFQLIFRKIEQISNMTSMSSLSNWTITFNLTFWIKSSIRHYCSPRRLLIWGPLTLLMPLISVANFCLVVKASCKEKWSGGTVDWPFMSCILNVSVTSKLREFSLHRIKFACTQPKCPNQVGSLDFLWSAYCSSTSFFFGLLLPIKRARSPVKNHHTVSLLKQKH